VRSIYVPPGGPPQGPPLDRRMFAAIGEDGIRQLLLLHYGNLSRSSIQGMFATDLEKAANRSADFFIQIMGGPPLYSQKHGPPRMRARHMPFLITEEARQVWLDCFLRAMEDLPFPAEFAPEFKRFLDEFSAWMVNAKSD